MIIPKVYKIQHIPYENMSTKKSLLEYFIVPYNDERFMIYFPLKGIISLVNKDFINEINTKNPTIKKFFKLISNQKTIKIENNFDYAKYITLELTAACNLNCVYCYVNDRDKTKYMDWETAKAGIDYGVKQCNGSMFLVNFFGDGEQFLAFPMMKRCYEYAKRLCNMKNIEIQPVCTTNGTLLTEDIVKWMKKNNMKLIISFDGTPEIQNKQRPFKNGSRSYDSVVNAIKLLNQYKINYAVNICITKYSLSEIEKIVRHLHSLKIKLIDMSPICETGRCSETRTEGPVLTDLKKTIQNIEILLKKYNIKFIDDSNFHNIGSKKIELYDRYCGRIFGITSDGNITSCPLVMNSNEPISKILFYGKIKNGKIIIDKRKLEYLKNRTVNNISKCKDCFAKYYCLGECPLEIFKKTGSIYKPFEKNCIIKRNKFKNILIDIIK